MQCSFTFCLTCEDKYHFFKQCPSLKVSKEAAHSIMEKKLAVLQSKLLATAEEEVKIYQ